MDLVLGLSMTSTAVRWVLVEGTTGEGAPIDRGALDISAIERFDADGLLGALLDDEETVAESRVRAIGVTWTSNAEAAASTVLQALAARGLENVVAVSEMEAAEALASGIADITAYDDVAACIVEPDAAVVAMVNAEGVTVDRIARPLDKADAVELTSSVVAMLDLDDRRPDAIFVLGSDDFDPIVSSLDDVATSPVISAAEADMALARGAALASARAVNTLDTQAASVRPHLSRIGALTSVLVAAVVTFVVALSVALGLRFTPEQPQIASAVDGAVREAVPPSVAEAAPQPPPPAAPPPPPPPAAPPPEALPPVAETIAVVAPPVPEVAEPVYEPPAAPPPAPVYVPPAPPPAAPPPAPVYVPPAPAPAYVPPAPGYVRPPPGYVPPPGTYPKPRLRDRIIERIPIINRFHEPELQYPR